MEQIIRTYQKHFAEMICKGLSSAFPFKSFQVVAVGGSLDWRVVVPSEEVQGNQLREMQQWAQGFHSAITAGWLC